MIRRQRKRFYAEVAVAPEEGGHGILLDGRAVRTPGRRRLLLPTRAFAEAVAEEWRRQEDSIDAKTMPLTGLANAAIDRVAVAHGEIVDRLAGYADADLLCYRAADPPDLADRQAAAWQPLLDWAEGRYGAALRVTTGIVAIGQPEAAVAALKGAVAALEPFPLAALHLATTATGSLVVGLALLEGRLDAGEAYDVAFLDEAFQEERWGRDEDEQRRRRGIRRDIETAERAFALLRA